MHPGQNAPRQSGSIILSRNAISIGCTASGKGMRDGSMRDRPDRIAALDRQAEQELSLAKSQMIAETADRLRSGPLSNKAQPRLPLQLFRN